MMDEWRSIESVPKDGTIILLHVHGDQLCGYASPVRPRKKIVIGYFETHWVISIPGRSKNGRDSSGSIGGGDNQFTHWQPLPAPPAPLPPA